jgi:hypothetical protein
MSKRHAEEWTIHDSWTLEGRLKCFQTIEPQKNFNKELSKESTELRERRSKHPKITYIQIQKTPTLKLWQKKSNWIKE